MSTVPSRWMTIGEFLLRRLEEALYWLLARKPVRAEGEALGR